MNTNYEVTLWHAMHQTQLRIMHKKCGRGEDWWLDLVDFDFEQKEQIKQRCILFRDNHDCS